MNGQAAATGRPASYRSVLAGREFRLLAGANLISETGDWLYNVALLVFVYDATGSATWVATVSVLRLLPAVLLGPFGGVVADRYPRARVLLASDLARAVVMLGLAAVAYSDGPPALAAALALLNTTAGTAADPATSALVPTLVPESQLATANTIRSASSDVSIVLGPMIGGAVLALGDPWIAFVVNAGTFLVSAALVRAMAPTPAAVADDDADASGAVAMALTGMKVLWQAPLAGLLTVTLMAAAFLYGAQTVQLVVFAEEVLDGGEAAYGYLLAGLGVGGVLAVAVTNRLASRRRLGGTVVVATAAMGVATVVLAGTEWLAVAVAVMVVAGAASVIADVVGETALQRVVPNEVLGRVFGAVGSLCIGAMLLGALVAPAVIDVFGVARSIAVLGVVTIVVAAATTVPVLRSEPATGARYDALAPTVELLAAVELLGSAPRVAIERMAASATVQLVPAATAVIREGEDADAFYVITDGAAEVSSTGGRPVPPRFLRTLGVGDSFGEIGLLHRRARTATVTATTPLRVLRLPGDVFLDALETTSSVRSAAIGVAATRLYFSHGATADTASVLDRSEGMPS